MSSQGSDSDGGGGYSGDEADIEEPRTAAPSPDPANSDDSDAGEKAEEPRQKKASPASRSSDEERPTARKRSDSDSASSRSYSSQDRLSPKSSTPRPQPSRPPPRSQPDRSPSKSSPARPFSSAASSATARRGAARASGQKPRAATATGARMYSAASAPSRRPATSVRQVPRYGSLPPRRQPPLFPTPATTRKVNEDELDQIVGRVTKPTIASRGGVDLQKTKDWTYSRPPSRRVKEGQMDDIVGRVTRPTVASRGGVDLEDKDFTYIQTPRLKTLPVIPGLDRRYLGLQHVPREQMDDIVFRLTRMTSAYSAKFAPNRNVYVDMAPGAHMVRRSKAAFV